MRNHETQRLAPAQDVAAARLDREAVLQPKLARGWQLGLAMVDAALRNPKGLLQERVLDQAAKLN